MIPPKSLHWFDLLLIDLYSLERHDHMLILIGNHILDLLATNAYKIFNIQCEAVGKADNGVTYQWKS